MKNTFKTKAIGKIAGIAALVAVMALSLAALSLTGCDNGPTGNPGGNQGGTPTLNGNWLREDARRITISGSTATITAIGNQVRWSDAVNKGYVKVGDQMFINLTSTGDLTWSGKELLVTGSGDVASGTDWYNVTLTMSADGNTLDSRTPGSIYVDHTFTRVR